MLKYKLIGDNDYIFDPQGTVLRNRGINDIDTFLNLDESVVHDYRLLKNIDKAIECLLKHIENKSKIFLMIDSDCDGYTSASLLYQYLKDIEPELDIHWKIHEVKAHGISNIDIPVDSKLVIVPDAGSNDFKKHKELCDKGVDVIILDHHEIEKESEYAIVVNSRLGGFPNLNLSGVGIVYKFCKALDDRLELDFADDYLDLVAVGNIADSMSMRELETRYYVQQGLKNINNQFLLSLIKQQEYSLKGEMNITSVSFYINPLINAVIRVGDSQDKKDMFKCFIGVKKLVKYKPRGSDEEIDVSLVADMARRCTNIRAKQGRMRDKVTKLIEEKIINENLNDNKVIFIHSIKEIESGLAGLVANQISSKFMKPTIILNNDYDRGVFKGSARGYDKGELKDFKSVVLESNVFNKALGHPNAHGVEIHKDNIPLVNDKLNRLLEEYTFNSCYDVDFDILADDLSESFVRDIYDMRHLWGKDVDEPYILIRELQLDQCEINLLGKNENTIEIKYNNIKYMIFKTDRSTYEHLNENKDKTMNLIGRGNINIYNDMETAQIFVDEFEVK